MAEPAKRNATYDDLIAVPEHLSAEIIFGALYTHPKPAPPHGAAQSALSVELGGPFQKGRGGPGGWIFMTEPELHLGPHVVAPDIAGWRRERMPHMPAKAYIESAPDWVCEIISPSTESIDRGPKRRIYANYNVHHLWLLNPVAKYLEVHALRGAEWVHVATFGDGEDVAAPPFEAVPFKIDDLWPLPAAPTPDES
jgi:Uma2 family endonuclease